VKGGSKAKRPSSLGYKVTEPTEHHPAGDAGVKKITEKRIKQMCKYQRYLGGMDKRFGMCCGDGI
jgi:hypothetical protein